MDTNQETVKAAATRMCKLLTDKGVPVKHSLMLEALATGFGLDNWRTLKAVLDAPRAPNKPALPANGIWQSWSVEALYLDNDQPFGQDYEGRTALEAAYAAIMERRTDFNLHIGIFSVTRDDDLYGLWPNSTYEYKLKPNWNVLRELGDSIAPVAHTLTGDLAVSYRWLVEVVRENTPPGLAKGDTKDEGPLSELLDYEANATTEFGTIGELSALVPTQALFMLCEQVEAQFESIVKMESVNESLACTCYQVRAMCAYFEGALNGEDVSPLVDIDFE